MKTTKNSMVTDLKLLIDISCIEEKGVDSFKQFHKMLIRMSYKATDVLIDYESKKVYMKVLTEDESYDSAKINAFAETISAHLNYKNLNVFLKSCILGDVDRLKFYYPFLIAHFDKRKKKVEPLKFLEVAS